MLNSLIVGISLCFAGTGEADSTRIVASDSVAIDSVTGDRRVLSGSRPSAPRSWRAGTAANSRNDTARPGSTARVKNRPYFGGKIGHSFDSTMKNPRHAGISIAAWGERIGFQVGIPLSDSSSDLVFGVGGAYSIDNSRSGNVRYRTVFREISASCDFRRTPGWGANGSGWDAFYDLGLHFRSFWHHAVADSEKTTLVYEPNNGLYMSRVVGDPQTTDHDGVGIQPYFGIGVSRAVFGEGTRFQVRLGTGPEWLFAGSHSRFALRHQGAIGLEFRL